MVTRIRVDVEAATGPDAYHLLDRATDRVHAAVAGFNIDACGDAGDYEFVEDHVGSKIRDNGSILHSGHRTIAYKACGGPSTALTEAELAPRMFGLHVAAPDGGVHVIEASPVDTVADVASRAAARFGIHPLIGWTFSVGDSGLVANPAAGAHVLRHLTDWSLGLRLRVFPNTVLWDQVEAVVHASTIEALELEVPRGVQFG